MMLLNVVVVVTKRVEIATHKEKIRCYFGPNVAAFEQEQSAHDCKHTYRLAEFEQEQSALEQKHTYGKGRLTEGRRLRVL